ncbi:MATE family efflux transporter [Acinetobacter sp. MD2(2019)]|uniref:MATE family efflux transporter n=1 Tax=Acinetobacter sp. MD2(2019) TaxID=2605273 RepID=UPI002D1E6F53|nr:MATE family efflux transporter [Acinetobacter sp. MD2(2019)]MEB3754920.1 MATE family efflux transporter [Acinetobacter sp. MD2(2019)]
MKQRLVFSEQNLWKTFLAFLLPLVATNILQNLSGTINTIFVGQMLGVDAIAAVSVFFPILFCLMAFVIGLSAGTTILVGQAWGAQNLERVQQVVGTTLFLTFFGGLLIAAFGIFFAPNILLLLGVDPHILHLAVPYVRSMLAGSPLIFVYIIYTSVLRGVGDSITPLIALAMTSVLGLMITPAFIQGYWGLPKIGIIAPALASIIGNIAVLLFLTVYLNLRKHPLRPNRQFISHLRFKPELGKIILKLGVPTGIQMVTTSLAGLVVVSLVNQYGAHATAAYGAVNQVLNYIQFPALSIAIAASIFAAQAIGAGKAHLLTKVMHTAMRMNLMITGSLIVLAYLFSWHLMALFITAPEVVALGQNLLFIVLWAILFFGANAIFASIMRASGTVTAPMLINIGSILLIELPCAYLFSHLWGLIGIWIAYALAFVCLCLLQGGYYHFVWKKRAIHRLV